MEKKQNLTNFILLTLFAAIIVVMAFVPFLGYIPLGVIRATTIHIPVIIGSILLGPKKGAFLGFVFGLTSFVTNTFMPSSLTAFVFSPVLCFNLGNYWGILFSTLICFIPRILVGVFPYFIWRGLKRFNESVSLILAGLIGSLTNTILVMNMIFFFFRSDYAAAKNIAADTLYSVILGVIGVNGVPEAIVAAILTVVLGKVLLTYQRKRIQ